MINANEAKKIMLSSDNEKLIATISIYKAILDYKRECRIDSWLSDRTISWIREHGYRILRSNKSITISW